MAYFKEQPKPTLKKIIDKAKGFKPNKEITLEKKCLMCSNPLKSYDNQLRGYCETCNKILSK